METHRNTVERAYAKLNNATKITFTPDEWMTLLAGLGIALAIAMPTMTGIPSKYASPATLFAVFTALTFIRHRTNDWLKWAVINAAGCFVLYAILAIFNSKH